ncbi:MAG: S24/S26 family peptidase [Oscillospiraceae bacterium]|nr:S24/S26 family peptidase [Oscillospiraceae bacterium]
MEPDLRILPAERAMERILDLLGETESVPLVISGTSMEPFLIHHRDTVYLSRIHSAPRAGDMVLYRRDGGRYILHRILKVQGDTLDLLGDRQVNPEPGIRRDQLLAVVTAVRRNGKLMKPGHPVWEFYRGPWRWLRLLRPWLIGGHL